jgi:uncharacterized protein
VLDDMFVIDSISHAYNVDPSNYRVVDAAASISLMVYGMAGTGPAPYGMPPEAWLRDWTTAEVADMLFRQSVTDFSVFHPTPIYAYHDGMTSVEKAAEVVNRWPTRFRAYATVDPMRGQAAIDELDRQVELLDPLGVKLYPSSWTADYHHGWRLDDPAIAFPVIERARHHGLVVAMHKAIPFGNVPMTPYKIDDVDAAAAAFPDVNFEIVHGGVAFLEETAWLVGRFPNVWINLEGVTAFLQSRPRLFAQTVLGLCAVGGATVLPRLLWSTGCMAFHPRPLLGAFRDFTFPEDLLEGLGNPVPQLTDGDKRGILGENYARLHGLDIEGLKAGMSTDAFSDQDPMRLDEPYASAPRPVGRPA